MEKNRSFHDKALAFGIFFFVIVCMVHLSRVELVIVEQFGIPLGIAATFALVLTLSFAAYAVLEWVQSQYEKPLE